MYIDAGLGDVNCVMVFCEVDMSDERNAHPCPHNTDDENIDVVLVPLAELGTYIAGM